MLILILIISLILTLTSGASFKEMNIGFLINNEVKIISDDMGEAFILNSRTFVPLRFISESLGFKVLWEQETLTVKIKKSDGDIKVRIGSKVVTTPEGEITMDVEAFLKDNRTYVPIRFIASALGFEVDFLSSSDFEGEKNYDYYVCMNGELGNTYESSNNASDVDENGIGNIVSDTPEDWPKTDNIYQGEPNLVLARNKAFIDYMEKITKINFM